VPASAERAQQIATAALTQRLNGAKALPGNLFAWQPVDLGPVLAGDRVTPAPTVLARDDGVQLGYPGRLNGFQGEPESLKTFLLLVAAAQEIATGNHVVYLDYEDVAESAVERLLALGAKSEDILAHFSYYDSPPPRVDDLAEDQGYVVLSGRGQPSLVVFDGVSEAMGALGLDPNKGPDVVNFYGGAPRWFARSGAAVALLDHVTKDREGRGRWAIGSERKLSGIDGAAYALEVLQPFGRGRTGKVKITVAKDRPGYVRQHEHQGRAIATFELRSWPDGGITAHLTPPEAADRDKPWRPTVIMERVSKTLEAAPAPLTLRAVRGQTTGKGETVAVALELLVAEGYVATEKGTRGATLHRSVMAFRNQETGNRSAVPEDVMTGSDRFPFLKGGEPGTSHLTGSGNQWGTSGEPVEQGSSDEEPF